AIFMHAIGDRTVPFENLDYIYNHVSSKDKRKFVFDLGGWKHRRHLLTMYNSSYEEVYRNIVNFISRGT
ncbi:MAG: carboxylesterase, partial [Brevinematales bacterium]